MSTKAKQIRAKIITRFQGISVIAGYKTNAGKRVFDWREEEVSKEEMPAICFRDLEEAKSPGAGGIYENIARIEVEVLSTGVDQVAVDLELDNLYSDILKAIAIDDMWDGLADTTEIDAMSKTIALKDQYYGAIKMVLVVEYEHDRWIP